MSTSPYISTQRGTNQPIQRLAHPFIHQPIKPSPIHPSTHQAKQAATPEEDTRATADSPATPPATSQAAAFNRKRDTACRRRPGLNEEKCSPSDIAKQEEPIRQPTLKRDQKQTHITRTHATGIATWGPHPLQAKHRNHGGKHGKKCQMLPFNIEYLHVLNNAHWRRLHRIRLTCLDYTDIIYICPPHLAMSS